MYKQVIYYYFINFIIRFEIHSVLNFSLNLLTSYRFQVDRKIYFRFHDTEAINRKINYSFGHLIYFPRLLI